MKIKMGKERVIAQGITAEECGLELPNGDRLFFPRWEVWM